MVSVSNLKQVYVQEHKLGNLTVKQLHDLAKKKGLFVSGNKTDILKGFDQAEFMDKLWACNKRK